MEPTPPMALLLPLALLSTSEQFSVMGSESSDIML